MTSAQSPPGPADGPRSPGSWQGPVLAWLALGAAVVAIDFVLAAFGLVSLRASLGLVGLAWALYVLLGGGRTRAAVVVSVTASLALALVLPRWPSGLRKDFVQAARAIEPGMRLEQVDALMSGFRRGHPYGEEFGSPEWTYWHSRDGLWDFDHCRVRCGDRGEVRAIELVLD